QATTMSASAAEASGWVLTLPAFPDPTETSVLSAPGSVATVPASLRELVTSWSRGAPLEAAATLRTVRTGVTLLGQGGEALAELCDETVSVLDGRNVLARFRELHLRSEQLTSAGLDEIIRRLTEAGAVEGEFLPRLVRALGTRALAPADVPRPTPVGTDDPAGAAANAAVRRSVRRLQHADSAVRRRLPDGVHQMRVACRRLRSDLRTFGPLVEQEWAEGLRAELSWLAESLGAARDIEVLRHRFRQDADAGAAFDPLPLDAAGLARIDNLLAAREVKALRDADVALRSQRYLDLLDALVGAVREPRLSPAADEPCAQALPPLVSNAWARLGKHARRLRSDGADETWHSARIVAKRARYAAEAVAPVLGRRARRLASLATSVQEVLGEHQDAAIAAQTVHDLARAHPRDGALALVAGRLVERERNRVTASRVAFPRLWREAARAGRAWRR
ncbi:MAG: CHAD domain-containing protein, partial [Frankiaceae bacterium]